MSRKNREKRQRAFEQKKLMNQLQMGSGVNTKLAEQLGATAKKQTLVAGLNSAITNEGFQGLNEALFPAGFNQPQVAFGQQQVSSTNTMFANLRGYMVSNMRQLLSESYVELGLLQTVVDLPVDDAFRGGVDLVSEQLSPAQLAELKATISREGDIFVLQEAIKWNRLFGGAGVVILVDQDPEKPLDVKALKRDTPLEFKAADMWELFYDKMNVEGFNPAIDAVAFEFYSYYGHKTHRSRVFKLKGLTAPSFIRPRLRGWGFSVVEGLIRSINQHLKGVDLIFELLDEAKLDVYGLKNLADTLLMQNGTQLVQQRVAIANRQKNFQTALVLDSEDTYTQKELSFQGIADIMKEIRIQVASDLRMPMNKLFGESASGFSSGQDSIENYNAMVESTVREKAKYDIIKMVELRCQQLFQMIPTDLSVEFKPLKVMSENEIEDIKTKKFGRLMEARKINEITRLEFRQAINKAQLLPIQLDVNTVTLGDKNQAEQTTLPPVAPGATDGSNRSDSEMQTPVINAYPPCKNPNCAKYGEPHANCKCYNTSDHFCSKDQEHQLNCEYRKA